MLARAAICILFVIGCQANNAFAESEVPTLDKLLQQAENTLKNLKDYDGEIIRKERMQGKLVKQYNSFKFARPFKVYLGFIKPFKGREVLYRPGW